MSDPRRRALLPVLLAIATGAFFARLAAGWSLRAGDLHERGYGFFLDLAANIWAGHGLALADGTPTAFRVPGYPAFLALVTQGQPVVWPVLVAQSLVGAASVVTAGFLAHTLYGRRAGILAAGLCALYPYFVVHDTAIQETSLTVLLALVATLLIGRAHDRGSIAAASLTGLVAGIAVLTRANLLPFAMLAPVCIAVPQAGARWPDARRLLASLACGLALALVLAPWLARSYRLTGTPALSTQTGFFLWLGNNPHTFSRYPRDSIDRSQEVALAALGADDKRELASMEADAAATDRWFRDRAIAYMRADPARTLLNTGAKIAAAFSWLPSPRRGPFADVVMAASFGPVMLLAILGVWLHRRAWREHLALYAQAAGFVAVSGLFFAHTSYRAYLDACLIVLAAGALTRLSAGWRPGRPVA